MRKLLSRTLIFIAIAGILPAHLKPLAVLYLLWLLLGWLGYLAKLYWQHYKNWQLIRSEPMPKSSTKPSQTLSLPAFIQSADNAFDFALALGWPMASHLPKQPDNGRTRHPLMLHYFGLRTDLKLAQIQKQLPEKLQKHWFSLDLARLQRSDEARAAMAFACVRLSFYLHSAYRLGWLAETPYRQTLLLNGERAQECFSGWGDFASAFAQGRSQWLARGRSDVFGQSASAEQTQQWLDQEGHPWRQLPWPPFLSLR